MFEREHAQFTKNTYWASIVYLVLGMLKYRDPVYVLLEIPMYGSNRGTPKSGQGDLWEKMTPSLSSAR